MDKIGMREWVASLEGIIDNRLRKWRKSNKIENGEAVHLAWIWEQTHINLIVFWEDKKESVSVKYMSPRIDHAYHWHGLDDRTFNKVMDRVGNLAQVTMFPPIDPMDPPDHGRVV